jgi:hypothetical protein
MIHQPPVCTCFGGHCFKQFGCPNKTKVEKQPDKKRKLRVTRRRPGVSVNGKATSFKGETLVWVNPDLKED